MRRIFTLAIVAVMLTTSIAIGDVTIAFMSDGRPQKYGEADLKYDFDQLLVQMDEGWTLDAIQFVGDMDYLTNTVAAHAVSAAKDVPVFHCIGNHEVDNQYDLYAVRDAFENYHFNPTPGPAGTEETTYYYEVGDMLVVVINEYWDGDNDGDGDWYTPGGGRDEDDSTFKYSPTDGGYIPDELYDWLEEVLSTSTKTYKLVVGHEPAYPLIRHVGDSLDQDEANRDKFWNLLKTKGVAAYMTAHDHKYHIDEHDGVFEADTGVCGGMVGGSNDDFATIIYAHIDESGNFEFKAVREQPGAGNWDNPVVIREILTPPSPMATNPNPPDEATEVDVDADLSWTAGSDATSHDVYFGEDSANLLLVSEGQSETTYDLETLANEVTYYWRIDEIDSEMTVHTGDVWSFMTAAVPGQASSPNPADGATDVTIDADLSWTAGIGATMHQIYFAGDPVVEQPLGNETYDPGQLLPDTVYSWRIDEVGPGGTTTGAAWSFTTESVPDAVADSDILVKGTVGGSYLDTQSSDDIYETITERESGGKPDNRYSYLEHKWTISVVGGDTVTFNVEAHKTESIDGDDFVFAYSTDDSSYTDMITVTKTSDDDTYQSHSLPNYLSGTVYIRVIDTDRTPGNKSLDTIAVDHMYIECVGTPPPPDTVPPEPDPMEWATLPYATGSTSVSMTAATALDDNGVEYYFDEIFGNPGGSDSGWQDSPTYEDTGLDPDTEYTYRVQARDKSPNQNVTDPSGAASARTDPPPPWATDPTPSDGQMRVNNRSVILSWITDTGAVSHDVYLGTDEAAVISADNDSAEFVGNQPQTTYDPPENLEKKTTYYWRIDERDSNNDIIATGQVWSFTTR